MENCPYHIDHTNRLKNLERDSVEVDNRVKICEKDIAVINKEIISSYSRLPQAIEMLTVTMVKQQNTLDNINKDMNSLKSDMTQVKNGLCEVNGDIKEVRDEIQSTNQKVNKVDEKSKIDIIEFLKKHIIEIILGISLIGFLGKDIFKFFIK